MTDPKNYTSIQDLQREIDNLNTAILNRPTSGEVASAISVSIAQVGNNPELVTHERMLGQESRLSQALEELRGLSSALPEQIKFIVLNELTADDISDGITKVSMLLTERESIAELIVAVEELNSLLANLTIRVADLEEADLDIYEEIDRLDAKDIVHDLEIAALQAQDIAHTDDIDDLEAQDIVHTDDIDALEIRATAAEAHAASLNDPHDVTKTQVGLSNVTNDAQLKVSERSAADGVAPLGPDTKIPAQYLPYQGTHFLGLWDADTNSPALASGVGEEGGYYIVNVAGTTSLDGIAEWNLKDWAIFDGTSWQKIDAVDSVNSVDGRMGIVDLQDLYYRIARFVATSAGGADADKPVKTNGAGRIDPSLIVQSDISHTNISDRGTVTHSDIDTFIQNVITASTGASDAGKTVKTNAAGYLDYALLQAPVSDYGAVSTTFNPTITRAVKTIKAAVTSDFSMANINISDTVLDGMIIRVKLTQGVTQGDIATWGAAFVGSNLIPLNSIGLSIVQGETDILTFEYDSARSKWVLVGFLDAIDA